MLAASPLQKPKERTLMSFLLALAVAVCIFLPFLIFDRGYFIFYGDFNVQQIPFYQTAHDSVRSGNIFWNWLTDLGSNFIGSYAFYLLGSPFFWITLIFPSAAVPFMMAPLLILKFALASLFAYKFLRLFLQPDYALLGGLLYAFSGFSIYNIFFNHFHESILYFPLMLLALELYMREGKRVFFALTVFLSALSNYYFFIGQVIFLIIYWIVRALSGDWERVGRRFFGVLFEGVVGTAMAGVILLPAFYSVVQNPRTENLLAGWDMLIYSKPQRIFDIIHSFFFPQDIPARAAFFPDSDNKWASMSAWLPVFGCTGVIAYFQSRKHNDWVRRLLVLLTIMVLIPAFNALFQLLNSMYYARWYYMFIIILVLATMRSIQDDDDIQINWKRAFGWSIGISGALALFVALAPQSWKPDEKTGKIIFGLYNREYPALFWVAISIAAVSFVLAALLIALHRRERDLFFRWSVGVNVAVIVIFGWYSIGVGKNQGRFTSSYITDRAIGSADKMNLPDNGFSRVDFCNDLDNLGMFWQMPSIQAFHSIVPGSVMEFYSSVGVERNVGSRPDTSHYALRGLLSVEWLFDYTNDDNKQLKADSSYFIQNDANGEISRGMPGWSYYDEQNGYLIYKNDSFIPMGFTYDSYMTRTKYDSLDHNTRELSLLKAIVLEDNDVEKYGKYLESFDEYGYYNTVYSEQEYIDDCYRRRDVSASSFKRDNRGFTAGINLPQANLVFFSVPYEDGWSATVNGKHADIIPVNVGFMAVLCPAGENVTIRFNYMTPGLRTGLLISISALGVLAGYVVISALLSRRKCKERFPGSLPPTVDEQNSGLNIPDDGFDLYKIYPDVKSDRDDDTD
ncbi:MAG: YfhO family protein [Oscillospiraceae bacterium]|nr:YfhO family protein [Oscillospiraceae bacterium]MDD4413989.1 YfhO family protein [Oscillospiraceae bacterium]